MTLKCRENPHRRPFSRLATVRRPVLSILALALGAAAAVALASCAGGEDAKLLPGNTAAEITENLDRVKQYSEEGECVGAEDAVTEVTTQIEALDGVDPKLVEALQRGATRLDEVVAGCQEETTETVEPSEEPSTEETEKVPPGLEKKEEKEREKEEKELEKEEEKAEKQEPPPTETTPEETPTTPTPPPSEAGGTDAPGGVSPGAPAAPGDE
jgi:outer membrane biosynthesis protein TonB